jgi:DNA-binding PadR family transcriptional regulator
MLKYALLGFLNYVPMTGYDLKQRIDRSTSHFWQAKLSQIYTTLKALEEGGMVTSVVKEQTDRPDRRVYSITLAGRKDLNEWLASPFTELSPKKETLILKMFFSAQMDPQVVLSQLLLQRDLHRRQMEFYRKETREQIRAASEQFPQLDADAKMWEATRRFGEMYEEVYVRWIEEMITLYQ